MSCIETMPLPVYFVIETYNPEYFLDVRRACHVSTPTGCRSSAEEKMVPQRQYQADSFIFVTKEKSTISTLPYVKLKSTASQVFFQTKLHGGL